LAQREDLEKYCIQALKGGVTAVKQIEPASVVTAPWVRLKCQFGCGGYNSNYCCPPYVPTPEETRKILDSYHRALMFHMEVPLMWRGGTHLEKCLQTLINLEGIMFKDGYYKAFVFLVGPCDLCEECSKITGSSCNKGNRARPSMEACGIDVFQTARNNEFFVETLRDESQTPNFYSLMLVD